MFIAMLQNGLNLLGVQALWQGVVTGSVLILAVWVDRIRRTALMALLELDGISKRFGGIHALRQASLSCRGRRGARPRRRERLRQDDDCCASSPARSRRTRAAVRVGGQELATLDARARLDERRRRRLPGGARLPGADRRREHDARAAAVARPARSRGEERHARAARVLRAARHPARPAPARAQHLAGRQHLTEVARVLARDCRVLAFDETTASLTSDYVDIVFDVIRRARASRAPRSIFISHRLHEVFEICDTITVLRDGEVRGTLDARAASEDDVIRLMVGRDLREPVLPRAGRARRASRLRARDLEAAPLARRRLARGARGRGASASAGSSAAAAPSCSRRSTACDRAAARSRSTARRVTPGSPARARSAPASRSCPRTAGSQGLAMAQSVRLNATMVLMGQRPLVAPTSRSAEQAILRELYDRLHLKAPSLGAAGADALGRQPAEDRARPLARVEAAGAAARRADPRHRRRRQARDLRPDRRTSRATGAAIVLVSSELPELLGLCDRIVVLREGRVVREFGRGADRGGARRRDGRNPRLG